MMSEKEPQKDDSTQASGGKAPVTIEPPEEVTPARGSGSPPPEGGPEPAPEPGTAAPPAPQPSPPTPAQGGDEPMTTPPTPRASGWTAEQYVQAFKEIVTAILAILLVAYTVSVARSTLTFIGDAEKITDAKDILLLMLGLAGVVVGYYFGRVPADAQATQAQKQAVAATAQTEQVNAQAQQVAEQASRLMGRLATAGATTRAAGGAPDQALMDELGQLQANVQQLSRLARSRIN